MINETMATMTSSTMPPPAAAATTTTLGMQLDAALAQLDSLSSTQLYILIVFVTVLISSVLLGNAQPTELVVVDNAQQHRTRTSDRHSPTKKMMTKSSSSDAASALPEPRWYLFRIVNYAMMAAFALSVVAFSLQFAGVSVFSSLIGNSGGSGGVVPMGPSTMLRFLVGWSVFLIYFFGFFGVSFVHNDVEQENVSGDVATTSTATATPSSKTTDLDPSRVSKKAAAMSSPSASCNTTPA
jgi:hypothetical protein